MYLCISLANDPGPKDVQVCSAKDGDCCKGWKSTIKVKFCRAVATGDGDFYVYQLKKAPECDMAYCAGDSLLCQTGEIYNPNSETCTGKQSEKCIVLRRKRIMYLNILLLYFCENCDISTPIQVTEK